MKTADSKLIANFMGLVFHDDENQYYNEDGLHIGNTLQYHTSWDWLMPVIDKCYQEHMSKCIADAVMTCDIDKTYEVIVEFIKEYNNNLK
jgi:gluconate kinase